MGNPEGSIGIGSDNDWGEFRERTERPPVSLKGEIERMWMDAQDELAREILYKMLLMMDAKDRARRMADYIATADPTDIKTYMREKKLGIMLVCDTYAKQDYKLGPVSIKEGDSLIQLHIPPRTNETKASNPLLADLSESMQLVSDYIDYHGLEPRFLTGCTYQPLVRLAERRYGFNVVNVDVPQEWSEKVRDVFHRFVDPSREPEIGFIYTSLESFQKRFPPRQTA